MKKGLLFILVASHLSSGKGGLMGRSHNQKRQRHQDGANTHLLKVELPIPRQKTSFCLGAVSKIFDLPVTPSAGILVTGTSTPLQRNDNC
jgi:hypothetical protein